MQREWNRGPVRRQLPVQKTPGIQVGGDPTQDPGQWRIQLQGETETSETTGVIWQLGCSIDLIDLGIHPGG